MTYIFFMKEFVFPRAEDGDQRISKLLMREAQLNLSLVFQNYLVYNFLGWCKVLVFLGYLFLDNLQFFIRK